MAKKPVKLIDDPIAEELSPDELLIIELDNVAKASRRLMQSRLKLEAITLLIHHSMSPRERLSPRAIGHVLEAAAKLDVAWLKSKRARE